MSLKSTIARNNKNIALLFVAILYLNTFMFTKISSMLHTVYINNCTYTSSIESIFSLKSKAKETEVLPGKPIAFLSCSLPLPTTLSPAVYPAFYKYFLEVGSSATLTLISRLEGESTSIYLYFDAGLGICSFAHCLFAHCSFAHRSFAHFAQIK